MLNPADSYDVDLRRLDKEERKTARAADTGNDRLQRRLGRSMKAARAAGKYQKTRQYDGPYTDSQGQTPAFLEGDQFGRAGSTNYADKPQPDSRRL